MKVIVAGLPNTGTEAVEAALSSLGYNVYGRDEHVLLLGNGWGKILNEHSTIDDVREMYKDVDAVADVPACYFWEEILMAYPDSKIIFTKHTDENVWADGIADLIKKGHSDCDKDFLTMTSPTMRRISNRVEIPMERLVYGFSPPGMFSKLYVNKSLAKKRYRAHNAHVLENSPKDQLLEYRVSDGWKPLCEFLGVDVPNVRFPSVEEGQSLIKNRLKDNPVLLRSKLEQKVAVSLFGVAMACLVYKLAKDPPTALQNACDWVQETFSSMLKK
uniref:uncharacterized protein LOC120344382 n=1 Tax=Styela clava TaxID=7725 RepID=UPI00193A41DF|nr:uncharacterized protein LOC120344382 [Styela clava]